MLVIHIIILLVLLVLSGFFSGIETAMVSISRIKADALLKQDKRGAAALHRLKQHPHKLLITLLIGNNLVNIGAASLATVVFIDLFGSKGIGIATGVMTFLILVFGEITPKTYAANNAERLSLLVSGLVEGLYYLFWPFVWFFEGVSRIMLRLLGSQKEKQLSEEELKTIVTMGKKEGILSREAAEMMHNVLEFEATKVTEIMTCKADIEMVDGNKQLKDVLNFVVKKLYSRYPVYAGGKDEIIGILDVDDVLKCAKNQRLGITVKKTTRNPYFVPESKKIANLLTEFEHKHVHMAIVVDEYGYVSGLVTVDDILEEIVGDIFDKSRRESVYIKKVSDKLIRVDAKASIEEINKILHLGIKEEHFDTIAGFIQHRIQRIPRKGEKLKLKRVTIEIDKVTRQGIKSVKIIRH